MAAATGMGARVAVNGLSERAWIENQVSETMCQWWRGQSAVIKDTLIIDGGNLEFSRILGNGAVGRPDTADRRTMYALDLKRPFDTNKNISRVFTSIEKDSLAVTVLDGSLLANDYELVMFGGARPDMAVGAYSSGDTVATYQLYSSGTGTFSKPIWNFAQLDKGVHRYVRRGAYVSVPSENLGFYIGGLTNQSATEIRDTSQTKYMAPDLSPALIKADMGNPGQISWKNITMDSDDVPLRFDAAAVWLPFGKKGSIALLGGVSDSEDKDEPLSTTDKTAREKVATIAAGLIRNVNLYDIDTGKWYKQETSGDVPPPIGGHCAVAVTAEDGKSHHIYVYGGWRAYTVSGYYDKVYVLSLPSFIWTEVADGDAGRYSHKCHQVAANKMMIVGGRAATRGSCLAKFVRVFNLNSLEWEDRYDPGNKDAKFIVNQKITDRIASTSVDVGSDVKKLMGIAYAGKVQNLFPYPRGEAIDPDVTTKPGDEGDGESGENKKSGGGSSIPKYVPPLLGVLLGLFAVAVILCGILFCIRRRKSKHGAPTETSTVRRSRQTWTWLLGTDEKRNPHYFNSSQEDIDYTAAPVDEHRGFFEPGQHKSTTHDQTSDLHSVMISPASTATQVRSPPTGAALSESDSKPLYELEDSFSSPAVELPANPLDQISEVCGDEPVRHPQSPTSPATPAFETPAVRTPGTMMSDADDYMSIGALEKEMGGGPPIPSTKPGSSD